MVQQHLQSYSSSPPSASQSEDSFAQRLHLASQSARLLASFMSGKYMPHPIDCLQNQLPKATSTAMTLLSSGTISATFCTVSFQKPSATLNKTKRKKEAKSQAIHSQKTKKQTKSLKNALWGGHTNNPWPGKAQ